MQYYREIEEEFIVHEDVKGSTMHMMMNPHDHIKPSHGYGGHTDHQFKPNHGHHGYGGHTDHQIKHDYGHEHGYGGHDDRLRHGYGGHDDGHHHKNGLDSYKAEYAESWTNVGNDYCGHGGKHRNGHGYGHGAHDEHNASVMKYNKYGAHEGHYGPHKEHEHMSHEEIRAPIWKFKGID